MITLDQVKDANAIKTDGKSLLSNRHSGDGFSNIIMRRVGGGCGGGGGMGKGL